jgi:hypothetical protein
MSSRAHGQIRRSQVITTYGPGALIDLPKYSAIVGGINTWPNTSDLEEIVEPRLVRKLQEMTEVSSPRLYAPPPDTDDLQQPAKGIGAWRFPEWFVVQETRDRRRPGTVSSIGASKGVGCKRPIRWIAGCRNALCSSLP